MDYSRVAAPKAPAGSFETVSKARFMTVWRGLADIIVWDPRRAFMARWRRQCFGPVRCTAALALWRTVVFLYLLTIILFAWSTTTHPNIWIAFLTNWGLSTTCLHFGFSGIIGWLVLMSYRRAKRVGHATASETLGRPTYSINIKSRLSLAAFRGALYLFEIATTLETLIVVLYWTLLYDQAARDLPPRQKWINFSCHAVPATVLWIDLMLGCHRPIDSHVFMILGIGLVYMGVNYAASAGTGTPLYPVLTWKDGKSAILVCAAMVGLVFAFFLISTGAWIRDRIARKGFRFWSFAPELPSSSASGASQRYIAVDALASPGTTNGSVSGGHAYGGVYGYGEEEEDNEVEIDETADFQFNWWGSDAHGGTSAELLAQRLGVQEDGELPAFCGPRFADTRKAFPCAMCHTNLCRPSGQRGQRTLLDASGGAGGAGEGFIGSDHLAGMYAPGGVGLGGHMAGAPVVTNVFTGVEADDRSDTMYPI